MKEFVVIAILLFLAIVIVSAWACLIVADNLSRQDEKEDPCNSCLRWSECNGVDENCPRR